MFPFNPAGLVLNPRSERASCSAFLPSLVAMKVKCLVEKLRQQSPVESVPIPEAPRRLGQDRLRRNDLERLSLSRVIRDAVESSMVFERSP